MTGYASALRYRAFGSLKSLSYANGRALTTEYDDRLRPTVWKVAGVLGYGYNYDYFGERTGRVSYAQNTASGGGPTNGAADPTLDRSYEYDHLGRLVISHTGTEARAHAYTGQWTAMDGPYSQGYEYDAWGNLTRRYGWGGEAQGGSPADSTDLYYTYTNNRRTNAGYSYDASGNLKSGGGQTFTYDAVGNQTSASAASVSQYYDGDGLRVKKTETGQSPKLYLRSSALGGQVVAEVSWSGAAWAWTRGYVHLGPQLLAVQQSGGPKFVHEDPVTKAKRVTDMAGAVLSTVETDPWGATTGRSTDAAFQPRRFTTYERDANGSDEAMFRRYNRAHARFDQPDPYDGSYDLSDPQSLNRYAYVGNDPVNFTDPTGLERRECWEVNGETICTEVVEISTWDWGAWDDAFWRGFVDSSRFGGFFDDRPRGGGRSGVPQEPAKPSHDPHREPERDTGPCAGVKPSELNYSHRRPYGGRHAKVLQTAEQHIRYRHISNPLSGGSQYDTDPRVGPNEMWKHVVTLNALTFVAGTMYTLPRGGGYAFAHTVPVLPHPVFPGKMAAWVGIDRSGAPTRTNTLFVDADCKTVQSSHPGFPSFLGIP